ncbi:MAG: bifunctional diaminohydroxyphosphoribosylaminopyrimidine deaminase/5-amino-6-(5-phosphoribosylamino)uracil reductase RibD [Ferruginibacter sp.]|nr:bifunctional diaminohydroxyphosphoribosylaminopyrimidine deaminase/5-amino-6-(5-phosphoribosylamino)uracil reductase RibD [Ferruginibacter sp.]
MQRCLQLAASGAGAVAPNPMVGAVLVHDDRIIGEGFHTKYGEAHAEVNCINSVAVQDQELIKEGILYVSLEPCNHYGKTPACTDLIIHSKIKKVVVACKDPFEKVNGSGIEKLRANGVEVIMPVLEKDAMWLNRRFFTFHEKKRPYIILKWAQSDNLKMAGEHSTVIKISNEITDRLVHKWRSEEAGIMVGTNTALTDDPSLTTRLWKGNHPVRVVVDAALKLPASLNLLDDRYPTIIVNTCKRETLGSKLFYKYEAMDGLLPATMQALQQQNLLSVIIEGGGKLLSSFIRSGLWDEARIITNRQLYIKDGINAPTLENEILFKKELIRSDEICYYKRN